MFYFKVKINYAQNVTLYHINKERSFMLDNPFPLKPNEMIETKFGNQIFSISASEAEIHFKAKPKFKIIQVSNSIATIYYWIEEYLHSLNPNLITIYEKYNNRFECVSISKRSYDLYDLIKQHDALWVYFQEKGLKIQVSLSTKLKFRNFYKANKEEFDRIMNSNELLVQSVLIGKNNPDRRFRNKITRYKSEAVHDWLNFNLVNSDPIPLLFEFFKELPIIRP